MKIVIFGGNGFIGRHLIAALSARGHHIVAPVRDREKSKALIILPNIDVVGYNPAVLHNVLPYLKTADAVINLVGILHERQSGEFVRVHNEFVRVLCDHCSSYKTRRLLHISALNASAAAVSEYLRSKGKAEQIVDSAAVRTVIIRPSMVYGEGDNLLNLLVRMAKILPLMFLPCADSILQPIAVQDLVALIVHATESGEEDNKILSAAGPEKYTLSDIVHAANVAAGARCTLINLGPTLSYGMAGVMEAIPWVYLLSRDNCLSATLPSVVNVEQNAALRVLRKLTTLSAGLANTYQQQTEAAGARAHSRR